MLAILPDVLSRTDTYLRFALDFDQTDLLPVLRRLDRVLEKFPVVGQP